MQQSTAIVPQPAALLAEIVKDGIEIVPQPAALLNSPEILLGIPWFHHVVLFEKVKNIHTLMWYARQTIEQGWSRDVLTAQIKSQAHQRQRAAITNFGDHKVAGIFQMPSAESPQTVDVTVNAKVSGGVGYGTRSVPATLKVFDSVLVVSDRNVIDGQLQDAVYGFERTAGVVATIKGDAGSKSSELAEALSGDKKIIVCTIQTFPALQKKMLELTTQGKRFAVIADEAHSSQTGEAAKKLKSVLRSRSKASSRMVAKSAARISLPRKCRLVRVSQASPTWRSQALSSKAIRKGLKSILLGPAKLYESLREQK